MPRICDGYSDPHDFCRTCFPSKRDAYRRFGAGEGPDDRGNCYGYDEEHPDYTSWDYTCEDCGKRLDDSDDTLPVTGRRW